MPECSEDHIESRPAKKTWTGAKSIEKLPVVDNTAGMKAEFYFEFNIAGFFLRDFRVS